MLTITISPFVTIKTGTNIYVVKIYTCSIYTWIWITVVEFWKNNHFLTLLQILKNLIDTSIKIGFRAIKSKI